MRYTLSIGSDRVALPPTLWPNRLERPIAATVPFNRETDETNTLHRSHACGQRW